MQKKRKLSLISSLHYVKLIYRSVLFFLALGLYISSRVQNADGIFHGFEKNFWVLSLVWTVYTVEMLARFFPSRVESMGCQKQFARNYRPTGQMKAINTPWQGTFLVILSWVLLNAAIGLLYFFGWIDKGILVLISLAYGVCDMICILFFCPFQTWFMKNRCCSVCRIYNWDFAMIFTPYLFIVDKYTWSLLAMSLLLLARWELTYLRHPERFSENTNCSLSCAACQEKLCHHKKQLKVFWKQNREKLNFFSEKSEKTS